VSGAYTRCGAIGCTTAFLARSLSALLGQGPSRPAEGRRGRRVPFDKFRASCERSNDMTTSTEPTTTPHRYVPSVVRFNCNVCSRPPSEHAYRAELRRWRRKLKSESGERKEER
jgi:hypothetical protein